jgi:hypothetical protein
MTFQRHADGGYVFKPEEYKYGPTPPYQKSVNILHAVKTGVMHTLTLRDLIL